MTVRRRALALVVAAVLGGAVPAWSQEPRVTLPEVVGNALGRPGAPVVLVEFTDLECPYCRQFHTTAFERLRKTYVDTGKVLFVSRDLPLPNHDHAVAAAHAARCAGEQDRYWTMRHLLLVNGAALSADVIEVGARLLRVDLAEFRACMEDGRFLSAIARDVADARAAGITVTPSFVLGRLTAKGLEGVVLRGAVTFETLDEKIKALLAGP